jgi:putative transcriptional regulator
MKDELFQELLGSVREGGAILRGEQEPARRFEIPAPDVRELRQKAGFSQREFATLMGISPGTLRNWEQGRRQPEGAARVCWPWLRVIRRQCGAWCALRLRGVQEQAAQALQQGA